MMTYEYKCNECGKHIDIYKPLKDLYNDEYCDECDSKLVMVITAPNFKIATTNDHYNNSLGVWVSTKKDITRALDKYEREHGSRPIEIQNKVPVRTVDRTIKLSNNVIKKAYNYLESKGINK